MPLAREVRENSRHGAVPRVVQRDGMEPSNELRAFDIQCMLVLKVRCSTEMANVREVAEIIAQETGAPIGTVRHVARRLGEARLLGPRNARGRAAPDLKPIQVAYLLVGLMAVADGLGEGAVQVGDAVQRVAALAEGSTGVAQLYKDSETGEITGEFTSFIDVVAYLLMVEPTKLDGATGEVGLTIHANGMRAWVRTNQEADRGNVLVRDAEFSASTDTPPRGLQRQIVLGFGDIAKITSAILALRERHKTAFEDKIA